MITPARIEQLAREIAQKHAYPEDRDVLFTAVNLALTIIAAEAREETMMWRPIETAPRDGTPILVIGGTVHYHDDSISSYEGPCTQPSIARWYRQQWIGEAVEGHDSSRHHRRWRMSDLAKRLRSHEGETWMTIGGRPFASEAAAEIERLEARNAELEAACTEMRGVLEDAIKVGGIVCGLVGDYGSPCEDAATGTEICCRAERVLAALDKKKL